MATHTAKVIATCLLLTVTMQMCCGSAIPIWEFLTRNEKMSYLYSAFAQLVSIHCKATAAPTALPVNQCKRNLLTYGNEKLQTFSDAQLDAIDPYQRGANELIWSSIMRDHPSSSLVTTRKPLPTAPATSIIVLTHQPAAAAENSAGSTTHNGPPAGGYPANPLFDTKAEHKHQYAMDMDIAYGYPAAVTNPQLETFVPDQQRQHSEHKVQKTYLTGPLVFRLRPDGSPVEGDQYQSLPRDDDLEVFGTPPEASATGGARRNKHKIATISALKQQHYAPFALQQALQPPLQHPRIRRQFQVARISPVPLSSSSALNGYFYEKL